MRPASAKSKARAQQCGGRRNLRLTVAFEMVLNFWVWDFHSSKHQLGTGGSQGSLWHSSEGGWRVWLWSQPRGEGAGAGIERQNSLRQGLGQIPIKHRAQRAASTAMISHTHTHCLQPLCPRPGAVRGDSSGLESCPLPLHFVLVITQKNPKAESRKDVPPMTALQMDLVSHSPCATPLHGHTSSVGRLRPVQQ